VITANQENMMQAAWSAWCPQTTIASQILRLVGNFGSRAMLPQIHQALASTRKGTNVWLRKHLNEIDPSLHFHRIPVSDVPCLCRFVLGNAGSPRPGCTLCMGKGTYEAKVWRVI
jgi:hypothetical protein